MDIEYNKSQVYQASNQATYIQEAHKESNKWPPLNFPSKSSALYRPPVKPVGDRATVSNQEIQPSEPGKTWKGPSG